LSDLKVTAAGDSSDDNSGQGLKQQLRALEGKLSRSEESLAVAEREHKDLQKQLDESKKLYSMVQKKNSLLKEQLKVQPRCV
jgi:chromosome segregation ATPase